MRERIQLIMDNEQLTPSAFADILQVGRAVMSHILNGRNNPSLEVVTRILSKLSYINPDWLIKGEGDMYKADMKPKFEALDRSNTHSSNLFSTASINPPIVSKEINNEKESIVEQPLNASNPAIDQEIIYKKSPEKKISKIIIYYTDNTFETFDAH